MDETTHHIFADIRTLLDTRLAALGRYYPKVAERVLLSGEYHNRRHNVFSRMDPIVNDQLILQTYERNDMELLKQARATNFVIRIKALVERYAIRSLEIHEGIQVKLTVNSYPYRVGPEFIAVFSATLGEVTGAGIEVVYYTPEQLTPTLLRKYDTFVCEDFNRWVNIHHETLVKSPMVTVELNCPIIYVKEDEDLAEIPAGICEHNLRVFYSVYVKLVLLPLRLFSVLSLDPHPSEDAGVSTTG